MTLHAAPLYIGLMSGTSMDGVDGVMCRFDAKADQPLDLVILAQAHLPFPANLRDQLLDLQNPRHGELHQSLMLANQLADLYADLVQRLLEKSQLNPADIRAIGCHGQTIRHRPADGYTLQIGNHARLAEKSGIAVIGDFRSRDIAAGGQGAPLVPAFHHAYFARPTEATTVVNIGGMANLSRLHPNLPVIGFDTGPGNVLLDAWIQNTLDKSYDENGQWASTGNCISPLLTALLAHPYYAKHPPKSCGREEFSLNTLRTLVAKTCPMARAEDVQATVLELTARTIAEAVQRYCPETKATLLCGGGAKNTALVKRLQALLPSQSVKLTNDLGLDADLVEAAAFAWLAYRHIEALPGNLPDVTGAKGSRILGAYYPA